MKRFLALLLCAVMALSFIPQVALAAGDSGAAGTADTASPSPAPDATVGSEPDTAAEEPADEPDSEEEISFAQDAAFSEPDTTAYSLAGTTVPAPSLTTGRMTTTGYHPINIQIENSPGARPQAGLSQADIVYECLMEKASVTRFQAVFNDKLPTNVGPVRSCRLYFVDIASEYKGILAFFGGPNSTVANIFPKISKAIKDGNIMIAANGLTRAYGKYYWRIRTRKAPHNVYTNLTKTVQLYKKAPVSASHFLFNAAADYSAYEAMNTVEVQYTRASTYDTKYVYDPASKTYKRYLAGKPFKDANTKKQVTVKNIIVQRAVMTKYNTRKGHLNFGLIGSGKADVYVAGKHIVATWERPTQADITKYYDASHNEIPLQPGNTWVQVIPSTWTPHFTGKSAYYSPYSAQLNVKVGTPASVKAKAASYNAIKLTWKAAGKALKYEIYRAGSSTGPYKLLTTTTGLSYLNRNVRTGDTYYYKVRAYRLIMRTKVYGDFSAAIPATANLAAPGGVKAAAVSYDSIRITWGAVAGKTRYEVYRATAADGEYKLLTTTASRSYTNKKVSTGTKYYYKVRAYRLVGSKKAYGNYSAAAAAKATIGKPQRVRAARASATSIKISWRSVAGASGYEVYSATAANGAYALAGAVGSTSFTHAGLTTGTVYYYKVVAYRMVGTTKVYGGYTAAVHAKP